MCHIDVRLYHIESHFCERIDRIKRTSIKFGRIKKIKTILVQDKNWKKILEKLWVSRLEKRD